MRRLPALRRMARETRLSVGDFIYPIFVTHGRDVMTPVDPMPGIFQLSLDRLLDEIGEVSELGIPAVLLFGVPARKDPEGVEAYDAGGIVQEAIRVIKQTSPGLIVATDVCLCEYTDHGHCGVISDGRVDNDRSLELLALMAESQAEAGADIVGPSAMMDGQVGAIREALDAKGFRRYPDNVLLRQVRLRVLWAVPRRGRIGAAVRRPLRLPDGSRKRRRGPP